MTGTIVKTIKYILDKKFPGIVDDVRVAKEKDIGSVYVDDETNYLYKIFIDISDEYYDKRLDIVLLIESTLKSMGIRNQLRFYWNLIVDRRTSSTPFGRF